jgi:diadenosine tetraphosphate (Ap4A) HIT family hydrolase
MTNATALKFGHPNTVIAESASWLVQLRPHQPSLGALVVICKEPARAFGDVSPEAFSDLKLVTQRLERTLKAFVGYEKINYLMLMMVDPDVHFHVLPRYPGVREHAGVRVVDAGWPGAPVLSEAVALDDGEIAELTGDLAELWARAA